MCVWILSGQKLISNSRFCFVVVTRYVQYFSLESAFWWNGDLFASGRGGIEIANKALTCRLVENKRKPKYNVTQGKFVIFTCFLLFTTTRVTVAGRRPAMRGTALLNGKYCKHTVIPRLYTFLNKFTTEKLALSRYIPDVFVSWIKYILAFVKTHRSLRLLLATGSLFTRKRPIISSFATVLTEALKPLNAFQRQFHAKCKRYEKINRWTAFRRHYFESLLDKNSKEQTAEVITA